MGKMTSYFPFSHVSGSLIMFPLWGENLNKNATFKCPFPFHNSLYVFITNKKELFTCTQHRYFLGRNLPFLTSTQYFPVSWMIMNSEMGQLVGWRGKSNHCCSWKAIFHSRPFFSHRVELVLVVSGYVSKMQIIINHWVVHWLIKLAGQ